MFGGKEGDMTDSNDVGSEYEALVRRAMSQGLQGLDCTLVQLPGDQNGHHGVVLAAVTTDRGVFRAVGEAWRDLLPPARRGETLTTAETRAKTRALREALGMPALSITHAAAGSAEPPEAEIVSTGVTVAAASAAEASSRSTARTTPATPARAGTVSAVPTPLNDVDSRHNQATRPGTPVKPVTPNGPTNVKGGGGSEEHESSEPEIPAKPSQMLVDGLGTDMLNRLLEMTKRKAAIEGNTAGDDEALQRLDSYFQRAFGHPLSDATRMEGQRVIQRLAADLSRSGTGSGRAVTG
jgi:hypothetical protein